MPAFLTPNIFVANPHFYDYLHYMKFSENGQVRMVDGGGQRINGEAYGNFLVQEIDALAVTISFSNLVQVNPYADDQKIGDLESFQVTVKREEGFFIFREEVIWKIEKPAKRPYLIYPNRYVFDIDPLGFARKNQRFNLYNLTEAKELIESARVYYVRDGLLEIYFKHKWYNVLHICEQVSGFNQMYINIATPAIFREGVLEWVDLDLDYRVYLDGSFKQIDQADFAENSKRWQYPPEVLTQVEAACREVEAGLASGMFPFDHAQQVELYKALKATL